MKESVEAWSLIVSIVALLASTGLAVRGYLLQRRVATLEEKRHADEQEKERRASVNAYFHRFGTEPLMVNTSHGPRWSYYTFVLENSGLAPAESVNFEIFDDNDNPVGFVDLKPGELPIRVLGPGGRYPIPWVLIDESQEARRFFRAILTWTDGVGSQRTEIPLRRAPTGAAA